MHISELTFERKEVWCTWNGTAHAKKVLKTILENDTEKKKRKHPDKQLNPKGAKHRKDKMDKILATHTK